jgi:phosphoribosylformylglycinamidine synthase
MLPGALLPNEGLRFLCRQVDVIVDDASSDWVRACEPGDSLSIPVKHTTGRYFAPAELLERIEDAGQVALRYAPGQNPNGSLADIAGVRNGAGNVMGLMPHPEHAVDELSGSTDGLRLFESVAALASA